MMAAAGGVDRPGRGDTETEGIGNLKRRGNRKQWGSPELGQDDVFCHQAEDEA